MPYPISSSHFYSGVRFFLLVVFISLFVPIANAEVFVTYGQVTAAGIPGKVLLKVIARDGKSKNYDDLLPLDGGTVGIAHFARGGLANLYKRMDTKKYFDRSLEEMISKYSTLCRPEGKRGDDSGWGCYSKPWWHDGMSRFLKSAESRDIQDAAWGAKMKPVVEVAISHGWKTSRELAIALGIANSLGTTGFKRLAEKSDWAAEATLNAYTSDNAHRLRRKAAIDEHFPKQAANN